MSPGSVATILVVEDEESFVDALRVGLKREGFRVEVARDGVEALEAFQASAPDLVLLDLMLPRMSGIDVCRRLRAVSEVPIVMVTAKDTELDTIVGLEVGADDYVTKPFSLRELVARIRAALRRAPTRADVSPETVEAAGVAVDPARHEVTVRGQPVELPLKEFELLLLLVENAGRVLPRDVILDRVWGPHFVGDPKTLDVHVKRLRARIEPEPSRPRLITTIRGVGYRFEEEG